MGNPGMMKSFLLRIFVIYVFVLLEHQAPVPVMSQIPREQYDRIRHGFPAESFLYKTGGNGMVTMCSPLTLMMYPFFVMALVYKKSLCDEELFKAWLGPTLLFPLTGSIVNVIKIFVGRPRPTFFARCYGENFMYHPDLQDECTGDPQLVMDGLKSFPSGHTALAFSSWTFTWLYVAGKTRLLAQDLRGAVKDGLWMGMFMIFYPAMVAASRVVDRHHHLEDICGGALIGILVACGVYFNLYPSLFSPRCYLMRDTPFYEEEEPEPDDPVTNANPFFRREIRTALAAARKEREEFLRALIPSTGQRTPVLRDYELNNNEFEVLYRDAGDPEDSADPNSPGYWVEPDESDGEGTAQNFASISAGIAAASANNHG